MGVVHGGGVGLWRWQRWQSLLVHGVWLEGRLGSSRLGRESGTVHPYIHIHICIMYTHTYIRTYLHTDSLHTRRQISNRRVGGEAGGWGVWAFLALVHRRCSGVETPSRQSSGSSSGGSSSSSSLEIWHKMS